MLKVVHKSTFSMCIFALLFSVFITNSASATDVDYNVSVAPALTLTIPSNPIIINLDPSSKTFDSKDFTVSVGTNNKTGYTLTLSTPNDSTNLNRDTTSDGISAVMPTLDSGTYTESSFTADKWGYKINSNTSIPSTVTSGFVPFVSGNTLMESDTAVNHDEAELSLAAKIDYLQPSGSYSTTLNFNIVAHPLVDYIQDFTPTMCRTLASTSDYTVVDKRDGNDYTVRYINGNCWMTQNLRFVGKTGDPAGTMTLDSTTSNVDVIYTPTNQLSIPYGDVRSGIYYADARLYDSGDETIGVWYNYAALSAMSIVGTSNSNEATQSLCPAGWKIPSTSEQATIIDYVSDFNPSVGGYWYNGAYNYSDYGFWPSSTANGTSNRHEVQYNSNNGTMRITQVSRATGEFIRCIIDDQRTISDITTMQEISPQIVVKMSNGDTATLTDSRDGQQYTVAKINGNLWMTRNLAIGCNGTGSTYGSTITSKTLTNANTNITSSWSTPTDRLTTNDYDNPRMECDATYGGYYNYAAATAGEITGASNSTNATEDICPAGWRLPTKSDYTAITSYKTQFSPTDGGWYTNGAKVYTQYGNWWSSTAINGTNRTDFNYQNGSLVVGNTGQVRNCGTTIRCIAK